MRKWLWSAIMALAFALLGYAPAQAAVVQTFGPTELCTWTASGDPSTCSVEDGYAVLTPVTDQVDVATRESPTLTPGATGVSVTLGSVLDWSSAAYKSFGVRVGSDLYAGSVRVRAQGGELVGECLDEGSWSTFSLAGVGLDSLTLGLKIVDGDWACTLNGVEKASGNAGGSLTELAGNLLFDMFFIPDEVVPAFARGAMAMLDTSDLSSFYVASLVTTNDDFAVPEPGSLANTATALALAFGIPAIIRRRRTARAA